MMSYYYDITLLHMQNLTVFFSFEFFLDTHPIPTQWLYFPFFSYFGKWFSGDNLCEKIAPSMANVYSPPLGMIAVNQFLSPPSRCGTSSIRKRKLILTYTLPVMNICSQGHQQSIIIDMLLAQFSFFQYNSITIVICVKNKILTYHFLFYCLFKVK